MSGADGGPVGRREVAYRLFAAEYDDADLEYSDSDEERAPNYVVTPTGARVNRLFVVGVLTEVTSVSDEVLRARVVDPTGAFVVYAGQYQPEAVAFLEGADVPSFVAVTGKARTFRPDDGDRTYTSVRPESVTTVDDATRDRWTVQAAEHTLARVATMAAALEREERGEALERALREAGVAPGLASGVALAIDHYGPTPAYLAAVREQALAAAAAVAGERESVPSLDLAPDEGGTTDADLAGAPAVFGTLTDEDATALAAVEAGDDPTEVAAEAEAPAAGASTEPAPAGADAPPEPAAEAAASANGPGVAEPGDLGDVEPSGETDGAAAAATDDAAGEDAEAAGEADDAARADPGLYELDEAEREAVEAEYGTEFSTGGEVGDPGEAGIEPEADQPAGAPPETEPRDADAGGGDAGSADAGEPAAEEPEPTADVAAEEPAEGDDEPAATEDVDLEDAVVEAMTDLDDGDGADRDAVVAAVVDAHGADAEAVEAAVRDALMGGRCYEPSDGRLKAI